MTKTERMASVTTLVGYAANGLHGRDWYRNATSQIDFVADCEGWDRDLLAGVLATSSPRCSVVRNIRMTLHFLHFRDLSVFPMRGIQTSVRRFIDGEGIAGQKTRSFYHNLSGRYDYVTLDVWMAYALGIDQTAFNRVGDRKKATERVVQVGKVMGLAPAEAQAAIWTGYRNRAGRADSPFSIVTEYFVALQRGWDIEGCSVGRVYNG